MDELLSAFLSEYQENLEKLEAVVHDGEEL